MDPSQMMAELSDVLVDSVWMEQAEHDHDYMLDAKMSTEECKQAFSCARDHQTDSDDEFSFLANFEVDDAMISSLSSLPSVEQCTLAKKAEKLPRAPASKDETGEFAAAGVETEMLTPSSSKRSLGDRQMDGEMSQSVCNTVDSELGMFYPEITARKQAKTGYKTSPGGSPGRLMSPLMTQIYGTGDLLGATESQNDVAVEPSRFCHICTKSVKVVRQAVCYNVQTGSCRKVICQKCFVDHGWDFELATAPDNEWYCCHCMRICPTRAQCNVYKKNTQRIRPSRSGAAKAKTAAAASGPAAAAAPSSPSASVAVQAPTAAPIAAGMHGMMDPAAFMQALSAMGSAGAGAQQQSFQTLQGLTPLHFSMLLQQMSMLAQGHGMMPAPKDPGSKE